MKEIPAALAAGLNLANDAVTAELAARMRAAGIRGIVLKGPSLRRWLYGDEPVRFSVDVDLLVDPATFDAIDPVMSAAGWTYLGVNAIGADRDHNRTWQHGREGPMLELHRTIAGIRADPAAVWRVLSARTTSLELHDGEVEVLDVPARAMHVALHAAQHGVAHERTAEDLRRALQAASAQDWAQAARLARELDATPAFAAGLRRVPEGRELAARLGLAEEMPADVAWRVDSAPPMTDGLGVLADAPGVRAKLRFVARHLVPPAGYMRVWLPIARRNRAGLALAYLYRPLWLLKGIGPAVLARRRARSRG